MTRASRFANVGNFAKELNNYYASIISDNEIQEEIAIDEAYEAEYYEMFFGRNSRVGWLRANKGLSLLEAVAQVAEEDKKWREETFEWLNDPANQDSEIYSDVYKDYYGFRPHY